MKLLKHFITLCVFFTLPFSLNASLWDTVANYFSGETTNAPSKMLVLIANDKPGVLIEVKGKYHLFDPYTKSLISTRFVGKQKFMQPLQSGLKWGEEFPGQYQIKIVPDKAAITTLVDGLEYQGEIYVYDIGGSISVVNEIGVEDYLKSTLSSKFQETQIPEELLAAIVIVARTNAYYEIDHPKTAFWAVDGSKTSYLGSTLTYPESAVLKAIELTKGMVLTREPQDLSTLFLADFANLAISPTVKDTLETSKLTMNQAQELVKKGANAAQILKEAFPGASISLIER